MRIRTSRRNGVRGGVVALAVAVAGLGAVAPARAGTTQPTKTASTYTVREGDTLSAIAARFGVSSSAIASANSLASQDRLSIGTRLTIPAQGAKTKGKGDVKAEADVKAKPKAKTATKAKVRPGRYVVTDGDTVIGLARRAGTSARAIIAANGLAPPAYMIRSGTTITIPSASGAGKAAKTKSGGSEASATSATRGGPVAGSSYRVRRGDTVLGLAARSGASAAAIIAANRLSPPTYKIREGQTLQIPKKGQAPSTGTPSRGGRSGVVAPPGTGRHPTKAQVGAALEANARRYGLPTDLVKGLAWQESGWRQESVSSVGAVGVMQLMPGTAQWIGDKLVGRRIDSNNYTDNVQGGSAYLDYLLGQVGQDERLALASYYQGLSSVRRKGLYEESKRYVASVQANRKKFR